MWYKSLFKLPQFPGSISLTCTSSHHAVFTFLNEACVCLRFMLTLFWLLIEKGYRGMIEDSRKSNNVTNLSMIRRFNHHSTMVLRACEVSTSSISLEDSTKTSNGECSVQNGGSTGPEAATPSTSKDSSGEPVNKKVWNITWNVVD